MRISDWSSDVCSSDLQYLLAADRNNEALGELYTPLHPAVLRMLENVIRTARRRAKPLAVFGEMAGDARFAPLLLSLGLEEFSLHPRSEEHTSELQSLMRISYAVFCLKKKIHLVPIY